MELRGWYMRLQIYAAVSAAMPCGTTVLAQTADLIIPAKSVVQIEITETISSKANKLGDTFAIKLAEPVVIADQTILPAGLTGGGEITHAAKSGWGGKAGELIVNARYLECGALRIPLGYFRHVAAGKNNFGGAFATAQVVPLGQFLVSGGEALIPAGAKGTAQVKSDVTISPDAISQCSSQAK